MARVLTADSVAPRVGAITLARHGEPALSRKIKLNTREYREFWARYEVGGILAGQTPPAMLAAFAGQCGVLVASTRLRAIESMRVAAPGRSFHQEPLLIEAPLPPPPWPSWIRLSPRHWGFFSRFWWWFFNHHAGEESRREAEARADVAAGKLADLAAAGQGGLGRSQGCRNRGIGRALRKRGWRMTLREGYKYWSMRRFERP